MTRLLVFAAAALMAACAQQATDPSAAGKSTGALVSLAEGGELVEVDRQPSFSIIEVRSAPQGSVPSSMFVLRGACAVARAREKSYFSSTPLGGPVRAYRLTFPASATDAELKGSSKSVFALAECDLLRF